jgi:flagellum-specific ATP synthase
MYSLYQHNRDLINVGAYVTGSNPMLDQAIELYPKMEQFLKQNMHERESYESSIRQLAMLFEPVL